MLEPREPAPMADQEAAERGAMPAATARKARGAVAGQEIMLAVLPMPAAVEVREAKERIKGQSTTESEAMEVPAGFHLSAAWPRITPEVVRGAATMAAEPADSVAVEMADTGALLHPPREPQTAVVVAAGPEDIRRVQARQAVRVSSS